MRVQEVLRYTCVQVCIQVRSSQQAWISDGACAVTKSLQAPVISIKLPLLASSLFNLLHFPGEHVLHFHLKYTELEILQNHTC